MYLVRFGALRSERIGRGRPRRPQGSGFIPQWSALTHGNFVIEFCSKSIQTFRMNLPNSLTVSRLFAVPLLVVLLLTRVNNPDRAVVELSIYLATIVFLGASITDYFDGYFARKRQQVTTLGMLLDPVADKLLTSAAFISLVGLKWVPAWMVVIIIGRDIAVSGLRNIASSEGFTIDASELGKIKMAMQVVAITLIILRNQLSWLGPLSIVALWLVVIFALVSAIDYFRKFWKKVDDRVKARQRRRLIILKRRRRHVPTQ
jgi:CDP-diacylglycerol---glycerol-3-phosphate 3-phosphatidyltransferase